MFGKIAVLSNGITVVTQRIEHVSSVTLGVWLKTGSRHDGPQLSGISHFAEHAVFKGTSSRDAERISRDSESTGGFVNAYTGRDSVAFYATVLREYDEQAAELIADLLINPIFPEQQIEMERSVILEEIAAEKDNPPWQAHTAYYKTLWENDNFALPIAGTAESVHNITRNDLVDFANNRFAGKNVVFVAAGAVNHAAMIDLVESLLGKMPAGEAPAATVPPQTFPGTAFVQQPNGQVQIVLGFPAPGLTDKRYFACKLLANILGAGASSRLYTALRTRQGLLYDVSAGYMPYDQTGELSAQAATSAANARDAVNVILREFELIKKEPVTEEELVRGKRQLLSGYAFAQEGSQSCAELLAGQYLSRGHLLRSHEVQAAVNEVTEEEIQAVANSLMQPEHNVAVLLGDLKAAKITTKNMTIDSGGRQILRPPDRP